MHLIAGGPQRRLHKGYGGGQSNRWVQPFPRARKRPAPLLQAAYRGSRSAVNRQRTQLLASSASLATVFMLRAVPLRSVGRRSRVLAIPSG